MSYIVEYKGKVYVCEHCNQIMNNTGSCEEGKEFTCPKCGRKEIVKND